ncbi:MAG: glycosyltransferase [Phycisphaerales bacterium]|nr:glycosyltransferase [Phycisphaerales bacterium]
MEEQNQVIDHHATPHPLVSICVMTYNHEKYIGQCLNSIVSQETDFPFEICIGEDESSDSTRSICQEYAKQYPDLIRLFLHSRSDVIYVKGRPTAQSNFSNTMQKARAKYMVLCDGDDYWSDPSKLQKQLDFLELHQDFSGCFHRISKVDEHGAVITSDCGPPPQNLDRYTQSHFLKFGGFAPLFSVMFRNKYQEGLPHWFMEIEYVDLPLHINNTQWGDYGFIDELMGCYRIHRGGMSNGAHRSRVVSMAINSYKVMRRNLHIHDAIAFKRGLRALYVSRFAELIIGTLFPTRLKVWFDHGLGMRLRRRLRMLITR